MSTSLEMIRTVLSHSNETTKKEIQEKNKQHLENFKKNNHEEDYQRYTSKTKH